MNLTEHDESLVALLRALPVTERESALERACVADPTLRDRRSHIIAALARTTDASPALPGGLTSPESIVMAFESALEVAPTEASGSRIGHYHLLEKIGEGGFGVVWMAEQEEPIHRRVALKIIKLGMDTEEVIARFEAERQALALMEHPNIARVFDAGATEAGRPYFVMELVSGVPITHFCDVGRLPADERLRLFIQVCKAVQHAHQKGIIHRDLKPSNILVALHDGVPVPKIIDFGIAKATGLSVTDKTFITQFHTFVGTPAYTSPEQMVMSGSDVDTRSDIYSLGVLLYELLCGRLPFDTNSIEQSGLDTMRRTIRELDPPRPSHRLGALSGSDRTSVAQHRGTDPARLLQLMRGDLDWIVMRCLEKDRSRRYETANGLAVDVERHLCNEPVVARPPSRIYGAKKFIRRHRLAVAATAAVAASVFAGLGTSSSLFVRERSARGRAVLAEHNEGELRRQAEALGASEVKRAARTALDLANRNLADGRVADGLAYLVYAARKDPENTTLAPRLASALATHNFLLPQGSAFECGSRVLAVRFTGDGKSIHVGTEDGTFREIDAASGRLQREFQLGRTVMQRGWGFPEDSDTVFAVRFADNTFVAFDVTSGRPLWLPQPLDAKVWQNNEALGLGSGFGISPDGRWIYALANYRFWIWDAATGSVLLEPVFGQTEGVRSCDFTADGSHLAVNVGNVVRQWTLPDARPVATKFSGEYSLPFRNAGIVHFSPSGRQVAMAEFPGVKLFDAATGHLLRTLPPSGDYLNSPSVQFASDTRLFGAGSSASGTWDVSSGEFKALPIAVGADVINTSFDAAGKRILTTGADGLVHICDLDSGELVVEPAWRQNEVFCAALAPDGEHVVIGSKAGTVQRFRVGRGAARPLALSRAVLLPLPAEFLPGLPTRLLWMKSDSARVFDVVSGREAAGGFEYPEPISYTAWLTWASPVRPDMRFMVVRVGNSWQSWELGPGGVVHIAVLEGSESAGGPVRFSSSGDMVVLSASNNPDMGRVGVWNLRTGAHAGPEFVWRSDIVESSPNLNADGSRVVLGTADGYIMVVDTATGRPVATVVPGMSSLIGAIWFSPDGTRFITWNSRNEMRIWDAATGEPTSPIIDTGYLWGGTWLSLDGKWLATAGAHTTKLWDGRTGAPAGETIPAGGRVVRFSRDGRSLGTADDEGVARVWDVPSGQPITEPMRHGHKDSGRLASPEFSPDGRFLRTQTFENFFIWSVPPRLPEGAPTPEWLLQLATVFATKTVSETGQLVDVSDAMDRFQDVRREIAALPADAPLADWARWILDDRADRSIAPGFTITPADAEKLAVALAAELAVKR